MTDIVIEQLEKLNRQGFQLFQQKLYPQTLKVLEEVVALSRQHYGDSSPALGLALLNRGRVYRLLDRNAECEADYLQALDIFHNQQEGAQEHVIWLLNNLSALYKNTGRRGEEEPYARELLAIYRATLPPSDSRLAEALMSLAAACLARDAIPEAIELMQEALTIRNEILGPDHPQTVEVRDALNWLLTPKEVTSQSAIPAPDKQISLEQRFFNCMQRFHARDYPSASQQAMTLIQDGTMTHALLQVLIISLQRSGQVEVLRQIAVKIPEIAATVPWERALLELTLGQADPMAVLTKAQDDRQRGQFFYYAAARLITNGRSDLAGDLLRNCVQLQADSIERSMAEVELQLLNIHQPDQSPPTPSMDAVDSQVAALNAQGMQLFNDGHLSEALPIFQQIVNLQRQARGENHPDYATALYDLGALYLILKDLDRAETMYRQAIVIRETALGAIDPSTTLAREGLAGVLALRGDMENANRLYCQVLAEKKSAGNHHNADWAGSAFIQGDLCSKLGNRPAAVALFLDALQVYREVLGPYEPSTLKTVEELVSLLIIERRFSEAERYCSELLEGRRATVGEHDPHFAGALENLALCASGQGDYARAESLWQQSIEVYNQTPEGHAANIAIALSHLGTLKRSLGRLSEAESDWKQALDLTLDNPAADKELIDEIRNNLALILSDQGKFSASEELLRSVLARLEAAHSINHLNVAGVKNNLATVLRLAGRFTEAEALLLQALESNRLHRGENDLETIKCSANLGLLYYDMAMYDRAEPLLHHALTARKAVLPANHPELAESLNNLGELYRITGKLAAAEALFEQALVVWQASIGEHHPNVATALTNMALLRSIHGDWERAEEFHRRALTSKRACLGEQHPEVATSLDTLAMLHRAAGRYSEAEPLCRQALEMRQALLGDTHPDYAVSLNNLAMLYVVANREVEALTLMQKAASINDRMIGQVFAIGTESQRLAYLATIQDDLHRFLSLIVQYFSGSRDAVQAAWSLVLRRKAIGAEALVAQRDTVLGGRYPALHAKLNELTVWRRQIGQKTLAGPGPEGPQAHQKLLKEWIAQKERLEDELVHEIPEMNLTQKLFVADQQAVANALPAGAALVEFVRFNVLDFKAVPARGESLWKAAHYLAFVLHTEKPDSVQMINLGEAEPIERMIAGFRDSITGGDRHLMTAQVFPSTNINDGSELRRIVFDPLLPALGGCVQLFLAPDGDLTRLPFEALPVEPGHYLIDNYQFSYVGVGRDILRFGIETPGQINSPLVVADPNFDLGLGNVPTPVSKPNTFERHSRALDPSELHFNSLPGTRVEGENIAIRLGVEPWLQDNALEGRLKACASPQILHIATHGFFLEDQQRDPNQAIGGNRFGRLSYALENPLLRSGLALAGANTWLKENPLPHEAEDGILTAEDVSGMDLLDTALVVLSACETGLGEVQVGEGVFGLRRAFVLAGAKTLVMSLWKVPDQQTQELMEDFYRRILEGQPRAEALRQAQLVMKAKYPDPLYWGAFICQGDPGPLPKPIYLLCANLHTNQ